MRAMEETPKTEIDNSHSLADGLEAFGYELLAVIQQEVYGGSVREHPVMAEGLRHRVGCDCTQGHHAGELRISVSDDQ